MQHDDRRVLVFTGDGNGKTTAALGLALRAIGHGYRVAVIQFVKNDDSVGEIRALRQLASVDHVLGGSGWIPFQQGTALDEHRHAALQTLWRAREIIEAGRHGMVILDEVCLAVCCGLLNQQDVVEVIGALHPGTRLVLTGCGATRRLIELADTVSDIRSVKHAFRDGVRAQAGVER